MHIQINDGNGDCDDDHDVRTARTSLCSILNAASSGSSATSNILVIVQQMFKICHFEVD